VTHHTRSDNIHHVYWQHMTCVEEAHGVCTGNTLHALGQNITYVLVTRHTSTDHI